MTLPSVRTVLKLAGLAVASALLAATMLWTVLRDPGDIGTSDAAGPQPSIDVVADLRWRWTSAMPVSVVVRGVSGGALEFAPPGRSPEHRHLLLRFTEGQGTTLTHERGADGVYRVRVPSGAGTVVARYLVRPGGWGRHGRQGHVGRDFAVFDGRVLMLPRLDRPVASARIRFIKPDDWTVAGGLHADDGWHRFADFATGDAGPALSGTCIGIGPFETVARRFGTMDATVSFPRDWSGDHKRLLADRSLRLLGYFHETLGFDTGAPYAVVWTPLANGARVFGGSSATGTCFQQPQEGWRNWQLLAHRIGHAFNKYAPTGMTLRDDVDHWFAEGWASYIEIEATAAAGIADREAAWKRLHDEYYRPWLDRHPAYDIALAEEPQLQDGDATEFIHYMKGPLVARMLASEVHARSGRTLEGFMREAGATYGRHRGTLPLRQALERYAGASLDDFWARAVDAKGSVTPPGKTP